MIEPAQSDLYVLPLITDTEGKMLPAFLQDTPVCARDFDSFDVIDAAEAWSSILNMLGQSTPGNCLLRGGCQTGKTSLIGCGQHLAKTSTDHGLFGKKVIEVRQVVASIKAAELETQNPNTILVLDEAHMWFASNAPPESAQFLHTILKSSRNCSVLFLTTSSVGDLTLQGVTPQELSQCQLWFTGPTTNEDRMIAFVDVALQSQGIAPDLRRGLRKTLFPLCGCNIGLLSVALRRIQKRGAFLLADLYDCRALLGGSGPLTAPQETMLEELLAVGRVTVNMACNDDRKDLVRKGYLVPVTDLDQHQSVHPISATTPSRHAEFTFANALQAERLRGFLGSRMRLRDVVLRSAVDLVLYVLPSLPSWSLMSSLTDGQSASAMLEAPLQHGMSCACAAMRLFAMVEVASREPKASPGRPSAVDLVVLRSCGSGFVKTALELVTDGTVEKHQDYFRGTGQHRQYEDRCVISFYHSVKQLPAAGPEGIKGDVPVVAVAPHPRLGFSYLQVRVFEGNDCRDLTIARFGVPVDRDGRHALSSYDSPITVDVRVHNTGVSEKRRMDLTGPTTGHLQDAIKAHWPNILCAVDAPQLRIWREDHFSDGSTALAPLDGLTPFATYDCVPPFVCVNVTVVRETKPWPMQWVHHGKLVIELKRLIASNMKEVAGGHLLAANMQVCPQDAPDAVLDDHDVLDSRVHYICVVNPGKRFRDDSCE